MTTSSLPTGPLHLVRHYDPGHSWLAVPVTLISALGIARRISDCSYVDASGTVYLEEDRDMWLFEKAAMDADLTLVFDAELSDEFSPIRNLPRFRLLSERRGGRS